MQASSDKVQNMKVRLDQIIKGVFIIIIIIILFLKGYGKEIIASNPAGIIRVTGSWNG